MGDGSAHWAKKVLLSLQNKNNTVNRCKHYFLIKNGEINIKHRLLNFAPVDLFYIFNISFSVTM
jgi:hypothetical protein